MEFVDRFDVPHAGPRVGNLTWGQNAHFNHLAKNGLTEAGAIMRGQLDIRKDLHADAAVLAFRELIGRHEALRTSYTYPDPVPTYLMERGQVMQAVSTRGEFHVTVEDVPSGKLDALTRHMRGRVWEFPFDIRESGVLRVVLLCERKKVRRIVFSVSHQAVDDWGLRILCDEFFQLTETQRELTSPVRHPIDQANVEATAGYRQRSRRGTEYLRRVLSEAHADQISLTGKERNREGMGATLSSAAVSEALRRISGDLRISPAAPLMACTALLAAYHQGASGALLKVTYARRHALGGEVYIAPNCLSSLIPFQADDGQPMSAYIKASYQAALNAYRMSDYHPDELALLEQSIGARLGADVTGFSYFNYVPAPHESHSISVRGDAELNSLARRTTTVSDDESTALPAHTRMQAVCRAVGPDEVRIQVNALTAFMPRGPSVFLLQLENLLIRASEGTARVGDAVASAVGAAPRRAEPDDRTRTHPFPPARNGHRPAV